MALKDKQLTLEQAKIIWDKTQDNATDIAALQTTAGTHTTDIAALQAADTAIRQEMASSVATMAEFRQYLGIQEEQQSSNGESSGEGGGE